jgi:phosphoribosylformimino-5-aminoimidazole carboxamide ribotide isomerase
VRQVYIADLDAIEGRGDHAEIIAALAEANPDIAFWVDAGLAAAAVPGWQAEGGGIAVIGSESQSIAVPLPPGSVLSLDFRGDRFLGPAALLYDASLWPDNVIVMTLARVGMAAGPDTERLAGVLARAGTRRIYAAGGVRDTEDLRHLRDLGVAGALVATALHNGKITNDTLRGL